MAFDPHALLALAIPETRQAYDWRDAALYALGTGAGMDPDDAHALPLAQGYAVLPTIATVLGYEGFWIEQQPTGIDVSRVLHGEQRLRIAAPLPPTGEIVRTTRVTGVADKGAGRGAIVTIAEEVRDARDGTLHATLGSTIVCRAEGGCGSAGEAPPDAPAPVPDCAPELTIEIPGSSQQALIYRLSGDLNPLHVDPAFAARAGFARPILHGLASYGAAGRVLIGALCEGDVRAFAALDARFTGPVLPGEPLRLEIWRTGAGEAAFRLAAGERVVLDRGRFAYGPMR